MEKKESMVMKKTETVFETIPQVFNQTVSQNGSKVALRIKDLGIWQDITWDEYHDKAKKVGCALVSMGFEKGDAACIIGDNAIEWVGRFGDSVRGRCVCRGLCHQCLAAGGICSQSL
ncbi:MAG: hypothetical protein KAH62_02250 [Desulfobacula sp.]|nr:hypothetical protein [Desulfobacula sp.]